MAFPDSTFDRLKYVFWRLYTPLHPYVRDGALAIGIVRHKEIRQLFPIGMITPGHSIEDVALFLVKQHEFGNHFVAWNDAGQVVSLRRVVGFEFQYHIRIFADGEVRGHYEYTPEYTPIGHMQEKVFEQRREDFLNFLEDRIVVTPVVEQHD